MRDNNVIHFLLKEVIPESEKDIRSRLKSLATSICYYAPELQGYAWDQLQVLLCNSLGDPTGVDWKERIDRIISGQEEMSCLDSSKQC